MKSINKVTHHNLTMTRLSKLFFLVGLALMISISTFAGTGDETGDQDTNTTEDNGIGDGGGDPDDLPIDDGIPVLIIAGVAYGAWHWYRARKNVQQQA